MFTMNSALLYDFQHLLMLTEVLSLPSIMFWKVQEVLTALEHCDDDLVKHLQLRIGIVGQVHSLDI